MTRKDEPRRWRAETETAQALHWVDRETGAVVPPVHLATTFLRAPDYGPPPVSDYLRHDSPAYRPLEAMLAHLEGAEAALVFGSGLAASTAAVTSLAAGDHLLLHRTVYWGFRHWLVDFAARWKLELSFVDATDLAALATALRPGRTKLVWIETPSNPLWEVIDIAAVAELAHGAGARLAVDNTVATPVLTRPLALGADLVMHSATKYLNGHSDVLAGVLLTARRDDFWARVERQRLGGGALLGPFEAWLLLRGLRTLFLRVERQSASALRLARHFDGHPAIRAVLYPGLQSHPQHEVARRQMQGGFGGMLGLRVKGGETAGIEAVKRCRLFLQATSLGGVESLIEHRPTIEGPDSPIPRDLLRLSIGLEHPEDLIADLEAALAAATS